MTKKVRIENADTSSYKVIVEIWDKGYPEGAPDTLTRTIKLDHPTSMTGDDCYLTGTRYLVVKEAIEITAAAPVPEVQLTDAPTLTAAPEAAPEATVEHQPV